MSQNNLELLFNLVQQAALKLKTTDPNADGKAFWQPLKKLFNSSSLKASHWRQLDPYLVSKLRRLPEQDVSGQIIEINHFLRQQVRIPTEETPNLKRIMQVALNSGQFLAIANLPQKNDSLMLDPNLANFNYQQSRLHKLETYITTEEILALGQQIPQSLITEVKTFCSVSVRIGLNE